MLRSLFRTLGIVLTFSIALSTFAASAAPATTVMTDRGTVAGTEEKGILAFKGIPYAAPPTGSLRWAPPVLREPWKDTFKANDFGNACPQPERPDRARNFGTQGEDCLTLNVWAPKGAKNAPVMLWIHGGAFRVGRGGTEFYSGENFAKDGIVFVSINYRLGFLGFFAHPKLTEQASHQPLGNYGLMDQIAALEWVQLNIAAFGGDPKRVTIFGESAGGSSVLHLMAIKQAHGLFAQAAIQSGGGIARARYLSQDMPMTPSLESIGIDVAKQLGADKAEDPIAAMRAMSAQQIIDGANSFAVTALGFGPTIDGQLLTEPLYDSFKNGHAANVPILIGSNSYEASVLAAFQTDASTLLDRLGPASQMAKQIYKTQAGDDTKYVAELAFGDISFVAPASAIAAVQSRRNKAYVYHLDYVRERARSDVKGAGHGSDIILVFNTLDAIPMSRLAFSDKDRKVASTMHAYWSNFGKTGNPNGKGLPSWPEYEPAKDPVMVIGNSAIEAKSNYRKNQLNFAMRILESTGTGE